MTTPRRDRIAKRRLLSPLVVALLVAFLAGCGSSKRSQGTTVTTASTTSTSAPTTSTTTPIPACTSEVLLPVVVSQLPHAGGVKVTGIEQPLCKNGYARLFAVGDNSTCGQPGGSCFQSEQVFLKAVAGHWQYLTNGSGINCTDPASQLKPAELLQACTALGLR